MASSSRARGPISVNDGAKIPVSTFTAVNLVLRPEFGPRRCLTPAVSSTHGRRGTAHIGLGPCGADHRRAGALTLGAVLPFAEFHGHVHELPARVPLLLHR